MIIAEQRLRRIVKEELCSSVPQDMYLRNDKYPRHIFERSYVTEVLGIRLPLNESYPYSPHIERRILQEHLLFEGFWGELLDKGKEKLMSAVDGVKKFGKEAWNILSAMYAVASGGASDISSFTGAVAKKGINKFFKIINDALKWMIEKFPDWKMPTFAKWAQKGLDVMEGVKEKVNGLEGWKRVIGFAGLAIGLHWLWEKIGDWIEELQEKIGGSFTSALSEADDDDDSDSISDKVKSWIKDTAEGFFEDLVGDAFTGIMEKLAGAFTGVKPWWDAAVKVAGGVALVIDALGSAAARFLSRRQKLTLGGSAVTRKLAKAGAGKGVDEVLVRKYIREVLKVPYSNIYEVADDSFKTILTAVGDLPLNHPVASGNATRKELSDFIIMTVGDELATPALDKRVKKAFYGGGLGKNL